MNRTRRATVWTIWSAASFPPLLFFSCHVCNGASEKQKRRKSAALQMARGTFRKTKNQSGGKAPHSKWHAAISKNQKPKRRKGAALEMARAAFRKTKNQSGGDARTRNGTRRVSKNEKPKRRESTALQMARGSSKNQKPKHRKAPHSKWLSATNAFLQKLGRQNQDATVRSVSDSRNA